MNAFVGKQLFINETLGERLKTVREESGISIETAAEATHIRSLYLTAIEASAWDQLPGEAYAKSFVKTYAEYLGTSATVALSRYERERQVFVRSINERGWHTMRPRLDRRSLVVGAHLARRAVVALIVLGVLTYMGVELGQVIVPPRLEVSEPAENEIVREQRITVKGAAEAEATVSINGQEVVGDGQGNFTTVVELSDGLNTIIVSAKKKHSRPTTVARTILVESTDGQVGTVPTKGTRYVSQTSP